MIGGMPAMVAAPFVPSLQLEASLGFDLALEARWMLLCLQFKISTRLVRSSAAEASVFGVPYYRFHLKTDTTRNGWCQHNTLCDLQTSLSGFAEYVFYAAPVFDRPADLTAFARARTLADHSVFVPPMQLGHVIPGDKHCFAYRTQGDVRGFSEPGPPFDASFEGALGRASSAADDRQPLREFLGGCDRKFAPFGTQDSGTNSAPGVVTAFTAWALDLQPLLIGMDVRPEQIRG